MRTVLKYPGSKWNIAGQLVNLIPEHHSYVEPFFGSGAVLFNKQLSAIETVNDLDSNVVNLFRCIQVDPERLARMVMTTPFSREIYDSQIFRKLLIFLFVVGRGMDFVQMVARSVGKMMYKAEKRHMHFGIGIVYQSGLLI